MPNNNKAALSLLVLTTVLIAAKPATAIRCLSGSNFASITSINCTSGVSSCFTSYVGITNQPEFYSGCGSCGSSTPGCVVCNTDNCNTITPSSISCYFFGIKSKSIIQSNGLLVSCPTGHFSCSSFGSGEAQYSNCGRCSTDTYESCVTCNTSNCNTFLPSSISCYHRNGQLLITSPYSYSNDGTVLPCSTGVTSCYSFVNTSSDGFSTSFAGCGICTSTALLYGCKACNTVNCNSETGSTSVKNSWRLSGTVSAIAAATVMLPLMRLTSEYWNV